MTNYSARVAFAFVLTLALVGPPATWADDLDAIRFGESALTFAAGSIQKSHPQDGVVNVTTGDNQTTGDRMQLGLRDTLYLRLKSPGDVTVGDLFTVFKRARKVFHPLTREYLGYLVIRLAVVEVVQVDKTLTTVRAVRAYGAVSPGDPVVKFALPVEPESVSTPSSEDITGMIVELQSDKGMTLVAQRNIVYVDRGRDDGVQAGDRMDVVRSGGNLPPRLVGEIKILSTEPRTATALVTKSTSRIIPGDRFRVLMKAAETVPVFSPVTQEPPPFIGTPPSTERASAAIVPQNVSREARITLSDLMKQLRYESGEATIRPEGYQVLDELIEFLKGAPADQLIRVEGHADNMEIGPSLKSRYPSNWDLSKARASGVLRYLVEKGGIDSARISSIGYGDTKPVVSNATEPGRQKNRRVDIVLYSSEADTNRSQEAMKSAPAIDEGYKVSGLAEEGQKAIGPALEQVPASPSRAMVDEPASIRSDQVQTTTPATPGDQSSGPLNSDPPVAPQP